MLIVCLLVGRVTHQALPSQTVVQMEQELSPPREETDTQSGESSPKPLRTEQKSHQYGTLSKPKMYLGAPGWGVADEADHHIKWNETCSRS